MALTYNEISAITEKYFMKKLVDNIFNSNAALQRWRKSKVYETISGGERIMVPLAYATTTASGWYDGSDTLDIAANDQITAAEYQWRQAHASINITRKDELQNMGSAQMVDFVKSKVQIAEKTLANNLGTGIYNDGTTANAIKGLRAMVNTTGTYGGIAMGSYSWWNAQVDSSSTVLSLPLMQGMQGDAQVDNDKFSVWLSTQDIFDDIYGLIQPAQRFQNSDTARAGFSNILVNGVPVIVDSHVPTKHLFGINENYVSMKAHKDENFRFEPFVKPVNQNVSVAHIYWSGALCGSNVRMQGKFSALV